MRISFPAALLLILSACAPTQSPVQNPTANNALPPVVEQSTQTSEPQTTIPQATLIVEPPTATPFNSVMAVALQVLSPQDQEVVTTGQIDIIGTAPVNTIITIDDQILIVGADQQFKTSVFLEEGPNLIEVIASDLEGNESFLEITVIYEPGKKGNSMKKSSAIFILIVIASLFFVTSRAFAGPDSTVHIKGTPTPGEKPTKDPGQHGNPIKGTPQGNSDGKQHGKPQNYKGEIDSVDDSTITLTLKDNYQVKIARNADTKIKIPHSKNPDAKLEAGMTAMVRAFLDENNVLTAKSIMAIPGKPSRVHRVGWVLEYIEGISITIQASDGVSYKFNLTDDTKILPEERAGELSGGSPRVTIIAPRDPSSTTLTAKGIVVHPAESGAGSAPPTP